VEQPFNGIFAAPGIETPRDALTHVIPPLYTLPVVPKTKRPSVDWIIRQRDARIQFQQERNMAMLLDEQAYVMASGGGAKADADGGEEVITSNILNAAVNKLCFMVGRQDDKIEIEPRSDGPEHQAAAQLIEDFLYDAARRCDRRYRAQGNQGLAHDETYYAVVRGWVAWRVFLDPNDEHWSYYRELKDPFNCYPAFGKSGAGFMRNMIFYEETTVFDFLGNNPEFADSPYFKTDSGDPMDDDHQLKVTWYEDAYYSIVVLDADRGATQGAVNAFGSTEEAEGPLYGATRDDTAPAPYVLVDEEHGYGFCPWVMVPCNGTPSRAKGSRSMNGAGLVRQNRGVVAALNRLLSQVHSDHAIMVNPPAIDYHGGPDISGLSVPPDPLDYSPGARNTRDLSQGQRSEILHPQTRPDQTALLYQEYTKQLDRGLLLPVLWGTAEGITGGFHMSVAKNAAEDALFPTTDTIIAGRELTNELLLNLVLVAERLGLTDPAAYGQPSANPARGARVRRRNRGRSRFENAAPIWGVLEPEHVKLHGVENRVKLRRMTPQDLLSMVQSAVMASQAKVLSLDWVRRNWLDIDDPAEMNEWIIYEATLSDPDVMKGFYLPQILDRYNPELAQWFQRKTMMDGMAQPGIGTGTPPGPMPPGGPGAGPGGNPPGLGISNGTLPAEMQAAGGLPGGRGDPQQVMAMLDQIIAQGGRL
jgi:hypothetical protein